MKNQTENQKEEQETELTCPNCGDEIGDEDSSFGVETSRGKYEDLCEGCPESTALSTTGFTQHP